MKSRQPKKKLVAEINVVPYIDVMLVLLVVFMIFSQQQDEWFVYLLGFATFTN